MIAECPACSSRYDVSGRPPGTKARCRCGQLFTLPEPSSSAGALSCPKCGAGVGVGDASCKFCEAQLLVKACPRCFARIFHGAKHCNQCGGQVDRPAQANPDGSARLLDCPRCIDPVHMEARLVGNTLLDECPQCHGLWLDACAVDRIVQDRKGISTQAVLGVAGPGPKQVNLDPPGRMYVKCPECSTVMNRSNFAKRSGIIVDTCKGHGTWFDEGELPRVIEFVVNGGMEAAAQKELERIREGARREKTKAMAARTQGGMAMDFESYNRVENISLFAGVLGLIGGLLRD